MRLRTIWSEHKKGTVYHTGESDESAFSRTLVLDGLLPRPQIFSRRDSSDMHQRYLEFQHFASLKTNTDSGESQNDAPDEEELNAKSYLEILTLAFSTDIFFITSLGYIGIGPKGMKADDQMVTFDGEKTVFVLQPVEGYTTHSVTNSSEDVTTADIRERWELIGDCYLHGFMDNEIEEPEYEDRRRMFFIQ